MYGYIAVSPGWWVGDVAPGWRAKMEEIHAGEMWTRWLIPAGTTSDPWSNEGDGLSTLSFTECQHVPGKLREHPPQGASRYMILGVMFPPPPDRLPKFSRGRGQRG